MSDFYVYMVRCVDDTLYTGYTTDPQRRLAEHNAGDGAKYTRGRTPVELVYLERYDAQSTAMSREYELKQLRRAEKCRLIDGEVDADDEIGVDNEAALRVDRVLGDDSRDDCE